MIDVPPPARTLEAAVAAGDWRRRRVAAWRETARVAPTVGLGLLALAIGSRMAGWPAASVLVWAGGAVAWLGWTAARALWPRRLTDVAVWRLDCDAGCFGELRSAHWFAREGSDTAWAGFHLASSAERACTISWSTVYPFARTARRWTASASLVIAALAVGYWPGQRAALSAGGVFEDVAEPGELTPGLVDELSALANGELTIDEARELARAILDHRVLDPELRRQLEAVLASQAASPLSAAEGLQDGTGQPQAGTDSGELGEIPEDVQWALGETASRLANEQARRATPSPLRSNSAAADVETGDADDPTAPVAARPPDGAPSRDAREASSAGGLAIETEEASGQETAKGEGRSSAGAGRTPRAESAMADWERNEALDREIVRASEDARGRNVSVEERHQTGARQSTMSLSGAAARDRFAEAAVQAAAVVPEARRRLMRRYFAREAE